MDTSKDTYQFTFRASFLYKLRIIRPLLTIARFELHGKATKVNNTLYAVRKSELKTKKNVNRLLVTTKSYYEACQHIFRGDCTDAVLSYSVKSDILSLSLFVLSFFFLFFFLLSRVKTASIVLKNTSPTQFDDYESFERTNEKKNIPSHSPYTLMHIVVESHDFILSFI